MILDGFSIGDMSRTSDSTRLLLADARSRARVSGPAARADVSDGDPVGASQTSRPSTNPHVVSAPSIRRANFMVISRLNVIKDHVIRSWFGEEGPTAAGSNSRDQRPLRRATICRRGVIRNATSCRITNAVLVRSTPGIAKMLPATR
ncbi:unannotated protein [freshwater metagenome]|uniref:Unannotated protein n=1 Tax=freshwater metagenome TaxID=449393 RepID=A0A6J7C491_9ZZZZ